MNATKHMDHTAYQAKVKTMSEAELRHVIHDAQEALAAYPENPNASYYQDEVCYGGQELQRRRQLGLNDRQVWTEAILARADGMVMELTENDLTMGEARVQILEALRSETVRGVIRMAAAEVKIVPDTLSNSRS